MPRKIAFQGEAGAYSHHACRQARPEFEAMACETFVDVINAVRSGEAEIAALPVENSIYGRVADIHRLLPDSGLFIIDEVFVRITINLLALPGAGLPQIKSAYSHTVLLGQCHRFLENNRIRAFNWSDTAGAARHVAETGDPSAAALASPLAGEINALETLATDISDEKFNRTRFLIMSRDHQTDRRGSNGMITAFMFQVRNIPAALYKALGGFATNQVNMIKLESYMLHGTFRATQFLAEVEGHPEDGPLKLALEELSFFTSEFHLLGVYPAAPERG
ncbi:MAG: prephenate dehydratase [Rhodobacteraceae bacterium]|nr:prephenate dehydratase [Paracoccaceae bacterium]